MGRLEIAALRFEDPDFRISDIYKATANTGSVCIQEGGWYFWTQKQWRRTKYKIWEWTAIEGLKFIMNSQRSRDCERMGIQTSVEPVKVWPSMDGYCIHLEGTDVFYKVKHAKVLGDAFNPKRILDQMVSMVTVPDGFCPSIF
jgi:hypothetical protein